MRRATSTACGCVGAVIVQAREPYIGYASVADAAGCMRWAEREPAARGLHLARLDCMAENPALCAYYERAGYRLVRTKTHQGGDGVYMVAMFEMSLEGNKDAT